MQRKTSVLLLFVVLTVGCISRYKYTVKICGSQMYSEVFEVNPAGVDEAYLTDSVSFSVYVGKFDIEHEMFKYLCVGDSINIYKYSKDSTGLMKIVDNRALSVRYLSETKAHIKKPLFEFK